MKKLIAVLMVFASLFSFAACKVEQNVDTDAEFQSNLAQAEAQLSERAAEQSIKESKVQVEVDEYIEKVGKTDKTHIVIMSENSNGRKYQKYEFSKKGEFKSRVVYNFFNDSELYDTEISNAKSADDRRLVDKDKKMRMVAVEYKNTPPQTYDEVYDIYSSEGFINMGYTIIE